jgi:hypothetical protein
MVNETNTTGPYHHILPKHHDPQSGSAKTPCVFMQLQVSRRTNLLYTSRARVDVFVFVLHHSRSPVRITDCSMATLGL